MRKIVLVLGLSMLASAQQAEPYSVNGVQLGSSFSEWKKNAGALCAKYVPVEPDVISYVCPDTTYAGAAVQETVNFYHGRLLSFYLVASHRDFDNLRATFKQKLGQPERTVQETMVLDGIARKVEVNRWSNRITSVNLVEFSPDSDHTVIFFSHIEIMAEKTRNNKNQNGGI